MVGRWRAGTTRSHGPSSTGSDGKGRWERAHIWGGANNQAAPPGNRSHGEGMEEWEAAAASGSGIEEDMRKRDTASRAGICRRPSVGG